MVNMPIGDLLTLAFGISSISLTLVSPFGDLP